MKRILIIFLTLNSTLLTLNSYSQWVQQSVPVTTGSIGDMKFANANSGFIINWIYPLSTLLRTTNAGYNWQLLNTLGMWQIEIVDTGCIYATGRNYPYSKLYRTSNLGITWDSMLTTTSETYNYLKFFNRDTGLISAGDSYDEFIYRTTDGGQTKQLVATFGGKFFFLKEKINGEYYGWIYKPTYSQLYSTTNSGLNWLTLPLLTEWRTFKSICFVNQDTGWATIGDYCNYVLYTTNGGYNWSEKYIPNPTSIYWYDIFFLNPLTGWIGSDLDNNIFITTNGGNNWGTQSIPGAVASAKPFFVDSLNGWAHTSWNTIAHTTNGGGTITSIISGSTETHKDYKLYQNYPNPFNSTSNLKFEIVNLGRVKIIVYDVMGREVQTLVNETLKPGTYEATFDGSRLGGSSSTATGIYFYQLIVDNKIVQTRKMILLK